MASRIWLITGSSSGFGRHIAQAALDRGDAVVATARRPEALDDLVAVAPDRVHPLALDLTRADQIEAAVPAALERFGRLDVLVNNAGHGSVGAIEEIDIGDLRTLMDTLFFGPFALTQAVLPHMRERRSGAIVQMSSAGGQTSPPGFGAYCSAKFELEAASEALATEVAPFGIRVLIVEPGAFRTEFGGARMHRSRDSGLYTETAGQNRAFIDVIDVAPSPATRRRPPPRSCGRSTSPTRRCASRSATTPSTRSAPSTTACSPTSTRGSTSAGPRAPDDRLLTDSEPPAPLSIKSAPRVSLPPHDRKVPMLPIYAQLVRRATESYAQSALPTAPVEAISRSPPRRRAGGVSSPPV